MTLARLKHRHRTAIAEPALQALRKGGDKRHTSNRRVPRAGGLATTRRDYARYDAAFAGRDRAADISGRHSAPHFTRKFRHCFDYVPGVHAAPDGRGDVIGHLRPSEVS